MRSINAAARSLKGASDEFLYRWAETAGQRAQALAVRLRAGGAVDPAAPEITHVVGAILGKGEAVYEAVLEKPLTWQPSWMTDAHRRCCGSRIVSL